MKYNWDIERVEYAVSRSKNFCETLRHLGVPVRGNNISTLKRKILEYGLSIGHFSGRREVRGEEHFAYKDAASYLSYGTNIQSSKLRDKLLRENILEHRCHICGGREWMGKPIPLQLHHIDGDFRNNSIENLQLLCPNCHAQTENYRGKSLKTPRHHCISCGAEISRNARYCKSCCNKNRRVLFVSDKQLVDDWKEYGHYLPIAKKYGVSDKTVSKRLKKLLKK